MNDAEHYKLVLTAAYAVVEAFGDRKHRDVPGAIENLEKVLGDGREPTIRVKNWTEGLFQPTDGP